MYSWGKELTLETVELPRYRLVATEDEGPTTIGSPPVWVDVIELFRSTFMCEYPDGEYPDVEAEGPRERSVRFSISARPNTRRSDDAFLEETSFLQDGESVWGFAG